MVPQEWSSLSLLEQLRRILGDDEYFTVKEFPESVLKALYPNTACGPAALSIAEMYTQLFSALREDSPVLEKAKKFEDRIHREGSVDSLHREARIDTQFWEETVDQAFRTLPDYEKLLEKKPVWYSRISIGITLSIALATLELPNKNEELENQAFCVLRHWEDFKARAGVAQTREG